MIQRRRLIQFMGLAGMVGILPSSIWAVSAGEKEQKQPSDEAVSEVFSFDILKEKALKLSKDPYKAEAGDIQEIIKNLTSLQTKEIRFKDEQSNDLKKGILNFYPHFRTSANQMPLKLYQVIDGKSVPLMFDPSDFDYGALALGEVSQHNQFSGMSLKAPLTNPTVSDTVVSVDDGGTFHLAPQPHQEGLSARVLGVNIADTQSQDIPYFRSMWIENNDTLENAVVYGLLDCSTVTGAYRIQFQPETEGRITLIVQAVLYPRTIINRLCLSPVSGMFYKSDHYKSREVEEKFNLDYRPNVHTADGLLVGNSQGEWLWRPLNNHLKPRITSQVGKSPKGFGLIQRQRDAKQYADPVNKYEDVLSLWVKPTSDFGAGWVELVEVPAGSEDNDNIMAYWVMETPAVPDKVIEYSYHLSAIEQDEILHSVARAVATYQKPIQKESLNPLEKSQSMAFHVEFSGQNLEYYLSDADKIEADLFMSSGQILSKKIFHDKDSNTVSVLFNLERDETQTVELRCCLRYKTKIISEIWNKTWFPYGL